MGEGKNYWICICKTENDDCEDLNRWQWEFSHTSKYKPCFKKIKESDKVLCYREYYDSWFEFVIDDIRFDEFVLSQGIDLKISWEMTQKNTLKILNQNPKKYYAFQKGKNELKFVQVTITERSKEQFEAIYNAVKK